ncbi:MAG: hypothetical protein K2Q06_12295 [Parvularculaceae bacterium]|nr:hypothetical protein [Parvularculaceae bacterium]
MPSVASLSLAAASLVSAAAGAAFGAAAMTAFEAGGAPSPVISAGAVAAHAARSFAMADADGSGALSSDEYASFRLVRAELARLNGGYALEAGARRVTVRLPTGAPHALASEARDRILAQAYRDFYVFAGPDQRMKLGEYQDDCARAFALADRNRDGVLAGAEVVRFAADRTSAADLGV